MTTIIADKPKGKPFNWKLFSIKAERLLEFASKATVAPVNAERWEEIVFHVLKSMGQIYHGGDPKWEVGSHVPGADIWVDSFAISVKSGGIKNNILTLSSYRLTRFNDLGAMKMFIDEGKNFDIYLCCARTDNLDGSRDYRIFTIPANIFYAKELTWKEQSSRINGKIAGWRGVDKKGIIVNIQKSMSNQLWINIPLNLCTQVGEIHIQEKIMGMALAEAVGNNK
jgi:hypothetical protein